ncbi:MAG: hypothetical protein MH137_03275 [Flavobacteriales bacterium]|nr:hypothetical protein [Flavobacteriales bacterium]
MFLARFSIFKSKKPKPFSYIPRYYNEEEEIEKGMQTPEERIRQAYGTISSPEIKTYKERMEERRLLASYDGSAARRKIIFLIALLASIAFLFFWLG